MASKITDAKGNVSATALSYGYIQQEISGSKVKLLYKEFGVFHVKFLKSGIIETWETFENLRLARKYYSQIIISKS